MNWFNFNKKSNKSDEIEKRSQTESDVYGTFTNLSDALPFSTYSANHSAMSISAVYRAVEIISDSIAMMPIDVRISGKQHKDKIENHNINIVFNDGFISRYMLIKLLVQSVLLRGNGFAFIHRDSSGNVSDIQYLAANDVVINYDERKRSLYYTSAIIGNKKIYPSNMIHLVKNSFDGINGVSVIKYASRSISIANNTEEAANDFYSSGCNLAGVITIQGQVSAEQRKQMIESWRQNFSQGGKGVAVLQGNSSYQPVQISAEDAEMLSSRKYNVQDIARFFGISPVLLGDTSTSNNDIEALQNELMLHTLKSYVTMINEEFSRKLLLSTESNLSVALDETELLKSNKSATADYYTKLLQSGVLCVNEVRKELGYSEIAGGDKHFVAYTAISDNVINSADNKQNDSNDE